MERSRVENQKTDVPRPVTANSPGANSSAYAAGHDLTLVERQEVFTEPDFAPLELKDFQPPGFPESKPVPYLLHHLKQTRLVLIGQPEHDDLEDKLTFARHVAACLQRQQDLPVREWISDQAPGAQRLDHHLRRTEEPTIFLLNDLHPADVDHDLSLLVAAARNHSHYVIANTHSSRQAWAHIDPKLWCPISNSEAYSANYLEMLLRRELTQYRQKFPNFLQDSLGRDELLPGVSIRQAAVRIRHPLRMAILAESFGQPPLPQSFEDIGERLEALDGSQNALRKWFLRLEHDTQVLILGLALFHGLFDDQMFAALERLIETTWRRRDPRQKTYDYTDLLQVGAYFRLEGLRKRRPFRIEANPDHLQELFRLAWDFHRRRLMSSLPQLMRIATEAVKDRDELDARDDLGERTPGLTAEVSIEESARSTRWYEKQSQIELFGSPERNRQLRASISVDLSRIGELSVEAVKVVLRQLATKEHRGCREIVAQGISRWRESSSPDLTQQLFALLRDWERARVRKELGVSDHEKSNLGATVALTLGYAGRFDPPNQLHPDLVDLLARLASRTQEATIRSVLRDPVIPRLIAWHPRTLGRLVYEELACHRDLRITIAQGYATAYMTRTTEVMGLLDTWQLELVSREPVDTDRKGLGVIVARTYGLLAPSLVDEGWTLEDILARLEALLAQELDSDIRKAAFAAAFFQSQESFADGASRLQRLVDNTSRIVDRNYVMRLLRRFYLDERRKLGWSEPPVMQGSLGKLELCLYHWLLDGSHPVAQQIATEAFAFLLPEDQKPPERQPRATSHPLPDRHPLPRLASWALRCLTLGRDDVRHQAHSPLAQWIYLDQFEGVNEVIETRWRWTSLENLQEFRNTLVKAFYLYEHRNVIIWILVTMSLLLFLALLT